MESKFTGGILGYIGVNILQLLVIIFTLGIATPWAFCIYKRWLAKHTKIDGYQVIFDGTGGQLFVRMLLWNLLSIVTFGIFSLWYVIKMQQWVTVHTHLKPINSAAEAA